MFRSPRKNSRLVLWEGQLRAARELSATERWQRRRQRLSRAGIVLGTTLSISILVLIGAGGGGPPFTFRTGETPARDIRAKIDFTVVEEAATHLRREEAAAAVYPVTRQESAPLRELQFRLVQLCLAARSGLINQLDQEMVRFWALTEDELKALGFLLRGSPELLSGYCALLPRPLLGGFDAQVLGNMACVKVRYPIEGDEDLRRRVEAAFADLLVGGVLEDGEGELPELLRSAKRLSIRAVDGDGLVHDSVLLEQVRKSKLVGRPPQDKGPIYLQFLRALKSERIAEKLYELVVGTGGRPSRLPGTLSFDPEATEAAREQARLNVPRQTKEYKRGVPLVEGGKPITEQDLALLKAEHSAYLQSLPFLGYASRWLALFLINAMLGAFVGLYISRFQPALAESLPKLAGVCCLITVGTGTAAFSHTLWGAAIVPLTMTAMVLAIAFDQPFALVTSVSMGVLAGIALGIDLASLLVLLSGLTVAVLLLRNVRTRVRLVQVGFYAALAYALMTLAAGLLSEQRWPLIGSDAVRCFFWGLVAGILLSGVLPFLERAFGIVTDISLLELADVSHPLLQELVRRAPGTYTHCMTVATLAEAAAEAIGANPLLTRVGACFHDIGKMLKPHYFIENQAGENRHEGLEPAMSTLIIIGHVKDGVELGQQHRLPQPIVDFIQQHHGTTLVEYFYHEAIRSRDLVAPNVELESAFRYPGPKPQNREIGIVMLADAIEGASRALIDPTPGSLRKLVHDILLRRLLDGQFDECGLTLCELRAVEDSLCKSLIALYHVRIKYPDAKTAG